MAKVFKLIFMVSGSGEFPMDMLRYDNCVPATPEDQKKIEWRYGDDKPENVGVHYRRDVKLVSTFNSKYERPTEGRWKSFLWKITKIEGE